MVDNAKNNGLQCQKKSYAKHLIAIEKKYITL